MQLFIELSIGLWPRFYMSPKSINKKKHRFKNIYMKCFPFNLVFYINFICIYSHDLKYSIKTEKQMKTKAAAFIFLVNVQIE